MKWLLSAALFVVSVHMLRAAPAPVTALAYHPEGKLLAAGSYQEVTLIDPAKGEVIGKLTGQTQRVTAVAFSKDGKRLAVASGVPGRSGEVRTYAVPAKGLPAKVEHMWQPHRDIIYTLAFSPDGTLLASAGYDRVINLVNPARPEKPVRELKDHSDTVYGIAFHPQGKLLASVSADRALKVWDVVAGKRLHTLADSTDWLYTVAWSPDGKNVAAAGIDKSIRIWQVDAAEAKLVQSAFGHTQPVTRLTYSADGKSLFSGSEGPNLKRWDTTRLTEKLVFPPQQETVLSMALSPDDKRLAIGRFDGACVLLDTTTGKPVAQPLPEKPKPPVLKAISPPAGSRGSNYRLVFQGEHLDAVTEIVSANPAIKVERLPDAQAAHVVAAQVRVPADVSPGPVAFTLVSPAGKSAPQNFIVDRFEAAREKSPNESPRTGTPVKLPATLVGAVDRAGDGDYFRFEAKGGQQVGVQALTAAVGSKLDPVIELTDERGAVLAESGNGLLGFICPKDGTYSLGVRDKDYRGGADMTYRMHVGDVPVVTSVFPTGVRRGDKSSVIVYGVNLGMPSNHRRSYDVSVPADAAVGSRVAIPVTPVNGEKPLGEASVVAGEFAEYGRGEHADVTIIGTPGTLNGVLRKPGEAHLVGFAASKGERLVIETHARRIGSPADTFIEVLDASNKPVMLATLRCVARTFSTFRDNDNVGSGIRLETWNELAMNDYLYVDGEVMRIRELPKNPDDDCQMYSVAGQRVGYLGTTPTHHAMGSPMYKVESHPPGTAFPPNGMPVFDLACRNDDGGPGFGKDSCFFFDPPADGSYRVRVRDARGTGGDNFAYRLTVRPPRSDFSVSFSPTAPAVWKGGASPLNVTVTRTDGFDGPVQVRLENLPPGFEAPATFVEEGQTTTTFAVYARPDAATPAKRTAPPKLIASATIGGKEVVREAAGGVPSAVDPGDIVTTTAAAEVAVRPGQETKLLVKVDRRNDFKGRIPLEVRGLPYGVRVLNIGLNGILVTERDTSREIVIYAEPWVLPTSRPFVVLAKREGKNTEHAARPVLLKVEK